MIRIENHEQRTVLAICCLFATLASVSVCLRFYVRTLQKITLQWDDWCILMALVTSYLSCVPDLETFQLISA